MSRRAWLSFATLSVVWGVPYLFIRVAVRGGMPPLSLAWARIALGAAILLLLARRAGTLPSLRGHGRAILAYAVAEIVVPFSLIATGEEHVSSSLAAIVIATVPLIIAVLALRFDASERPTRRRAGGLAVGFVGVVALVGLDVVGRPAELLGTACLLVSAVGYAVGPMILKHRLVGLDARATMGASLAVAAGLLTIPALLDLPHAEPSAGALAGVLVLGVVCTAGAFLILPGLVAEAGAGRTALVTYLNPLIAVALGVALLGERPGPGAMLGLVLILSGSWVATGGRGPAGLARALGRQTRGRVQAEQPKHPSRRTRGV